MWKKCCCCLYPREYEPPDVLELDYRHNSLEEVPPEIFTHERTLEKLLLGSNQIKDLPPNLFHCHELRELDLNDNEVKEIPSAVESLTRLAKLNIGRNCLGDVPDSIKNCKNLTHLDLSINTLTKLPEVICQLVHLEELFLNETSLEFLPANFGRLTKLRTLELRENLLQTLPKSMSRLHQLQKLDIGSNDIEELPEVIGTLSNLTELWADNNCIRDVPKFIGNLTKLTCLDLSSNDLQEISGEIGKCLNLCDVAFAHNSLTSLPDAFTKLENCVVVRINNNTLSRLPEDIGKMKSLQELNLISNLIRSLPPSIGLLRRLHTLYLDDNRLSDLPKEIGSCISLTVFSAVRNNLVEIPSEIGHLSNLKMLALTKNSIRNLPVSTLGLTNLGALWLTEGQNKPLVTLNREICPETGQHVVTCCLLPQLPPAEAGEGNHEAENTAEPPRRSARRIRFENDEENEPPSPEIPKPAVNGGLSRAPTPYPKELRALSKSASQIRQNKGQNGDATNISDEPVYEGDLIEDPKGHHNEKMELEMKGGVDGGYSSKSIHKDRYKDKYVGGGGGGKNEGGSKKAMKHSSYSLPDTHIELQAANKSDLLRGTTSEANMTINIVGLPLGSGAVQSSGLRNEDVSTVPVPLPLSSSTVGKTPPPYEIAAKRAAFFRSSGGAGTGRLFPEGGTSNAPPSNSQSIILSNQANVPELSAASVGVSVGYHALSETVSHGGMMGVVALPPEPNILHGNSDPYQVERGPLETSCSGSGSASAALHENQAVQNDDPRTQLHYSGLLSDKNANITSKYSMPEDALLLEPLLDNSPLLMEENSNFKYVINAPVFSEVVTLPPQPQPQPLPMSTSSPSKIVTRIPMSHTNKLSRGTGGGMDRCDTPPESEDSFRLTKIPSAGRGKTQRPYSKAPLGSFPPPNLNSPGSEPPHSPSSLSNKAKIPVRKAPTSSMQYDSVKTVYSAGMVHPNSGAGIATGTVQQQDGRKSSSRIPRFGSSKISPEDSRYSVADITTSTSCSMGSMPEKQLTRGVSPRQSRSGIPKPPTSVNVNLPLGDPKSSRKPWIFGSHRNARVVSVEYRKITLNHLGFTIDDFASQASPEGKGIYVTGTDFEELPVKVGDKILQVDGIDVDADNMGLEIVNKILSNCKENIQLLVSRQQ